MRQEALLERALPGGLKRLASVATTGLACHGCSDGRGRVWPQPEALESQGSAHDQSLGTKHILRCLRAWWPNPVETPVCPLETGGSHLLQLSSGCLMSLHRKSDTPPSAIP